jgi:hypothetical protein
MSATSVPMHQCASGGALVPLPVRYTLGLDLGKLDDFTALAIAEERPHSVREDFARATIAPVWSDDPDYRIPWLQRWPLGTAYHAIAAAVGALVADLAARPATEVQLFLDATGVGVAVVEIVAAQPAIAALTSGLAAVTITSGLDVLTGSRDGYRTFNVPKKDLVGVAQTTLQRHKLHVAESLPDAATLTDELRKFEARITAAANVVYTHREGEHDDLVLATALALWGAKKRENNELVIGTYLGQGVARPYGRRY